MPEQKLSADDLKARRDALKKECKDYVPRRGGYGCQHYAKKGACARPDYFMCVVWLKQNPDEAEAMHANRAAEQKKSLPVAPPAPAPPPRRASGPRSMKDTVDDRRIEPMRPPRNQAQNADVYDLSSYGVKKQDGQRPMLERPELLTEAAIEKLAATGLEVTVNTASGTEVTLVPRLTDQDRCELTYELARTLVMVLQVFPGATLTALTNPKKEEEEAS